MIEAQLVKAILAETILEAANLNYADLSRANLCKADLHNASGLKAVLIETHLSQATLKGANFSKALFSEATLRSADLTEANLSKADLSFANCIEANFSSANLTKSILIEANLRGAHLRGTSLKGVSASRASLGGADLREAVLSGATLIEVDLIKSDLSKSNLSHSILKEAKLSGVVLVKADLTHADLTEADLSTADLNRANLSQAQLTGTNLTRSLLVNTNLEGASLTGACLEDVHPNSATHLEHVICDYLYLKGNDQERHPQTGSFLPGEFQLLFQKVLETVDLLFQDGVDWTAFAYALKRMQAKHPQAELGIQSLENKSDGAIMVRVSTAPEVDKSAIHQEILHIYADTHQLLLESNQKNVRDRLMGGAESPIPSQRESINTLFSLLNPSMAAAAPPTQTVDITATETWYPPRTPEAVGAIAQVESILEKLAQRYPEASEVQRVTVAALEVQHQANTDPIFKAGLIRATQAGSFALERVLTQNPFIEVTLDLFKTWLSHEERLNATRQATTA
nr:pentapeptide repeat-containing protein [Petrachloros mirabilis]